MNHDRLRLIQTASWVSILSNFLLAGIKISVGLLSGSYAVIGDGIESLSDVITSIVILYSATVGATPPDPEHPWGHGRLEIITTKTLSIIMIMAGVQIFYITLRRLINTDIPEIPDSAALYAAGISIAWKTGLAIYKNKVGKTTGSSMMIADTRNMINDIVLSILVLTGVLFTRIFQLPIIDLMAGFGVSIWIVFSGVKLYRFTNSELMDSIGNMQIYQEVFAAVDTIKEVSNPHRVRIRRINSSYVVDLDVEVDGNVSVNAAHDSACKLENEIRNRLKNVFDIMVHIEPAGCQHHKEGYGLIPSDIQDKIQT